MGGQSGFGALPQPGAEPPAGADWEAHVRALTWALFDRGLIAGDEFRDAIERIPPAEYLSLSYYERWFAALEILVREKGLLDGAGG
jgi:nitrile hydratase